MNAKPLYSDFITLHDNSGLAINAQTAWILQSAMSDTTGEYSNLSELYSAQRKLDISLRIEWFLGKVLIRQMRDTTAAGRRGQVIILQACNESRRYFAS